MTGDSTLTNAGLPGAALPPVPRIGLCLTAIWWVDQPERVGEVWVPGGVLGRGPAEDLVGFTRVRPGRAAGTGPPNNPRLSRAQLRVERGDSVLRIRNVGRCELTVDGHPADRAEVGAGSVLELRNQLVLLVERRPVRLDADDTPAHPFGSADANGIVGETAAAWSLRRRLHRAAARNVHVLVSGPSGAGKELAARALHTLSRRAAGPFVSRNAATLPEGLVDAELFGNVTNYPNPGMAARPGLVGAAHGGDLYLDEIGELPPAAQAHLLRLLDDGEYQRLGDASVHHADLRVIAATNRRPDALKTDLVARFPVSVDVPGLDARAADVPLVARHLLQSMAADDPGAARFLDDDGQPRLAPRLVRGLAQHRWSTHVRELERLLWASVDASSSAYLDLVPGLTLGAEGPDEPLDPDDLTPEEIQAALDRHDGVQQKAWRELGLSSRHVLARLIKKHGLVVRKL